MDGNGEPIDSIEGITFIGSDGTTYGPYGGSGGTEWDATLEEGTSLIFISGYADTVLEGIGFHYCKCGKTKYFHAFCSKIPEEHYFLHNLQVLHTWGINLYL